MNTRYTHTFVVSDKRAGMPLNMAARKECALHDEYMLYICGLFVSSLCTFVSKTLSAVNETYHRRTSSTSSYILFSVFFCIELRCKQSLTEKSLFCRQPFRRFVRSRLQTKACSCAQRSVFYFKACFGADIIEHVCTHTHRYSISYAKVLIVYQTAHIASQKPCKRFVCDPTNCIYKPLTNWQAHNQITGCITAIIAIIANTLYWYGTCAV